MEQRGDPTRRKHAHTPRTVWSYVAALGTLLYGADAAAQLFPPEFSAFNPPVESVAEDAQYEYGIVVVDIEPFDTITITATTLPAWLTLSDHGNRTATLSGVPTQAEVGNHNVVLVASDGANTAQQIFTITVSNTADPPTVVTPIPDQNGTEGVAFGPFSVAANFTDADGDARTFSASGFPPGSGLSINTAGVISGTPTNAAAQASPFDVTVTATTSDGSVTDTFTFTVADVAHPPTLVTPIADQSGTEGTPFGPVSVAASFTDADGDTRSFTASGFPSGSGLSISTAGVISGTPTNAAAQASPFNVTVTATTSDGSVDDTFTFTVADVTFPPTVVTPIPNQSGTEGVAFGPLSVAANFTDLDGDPRTFSASGFPSGSGLSISAAGVISGTPTNAAAQASPFNITVTATTSDGSVDDTFTFTVADVTNPPTVVTPIPNQSGTQGVAFGPLSIAANFTDADGDARTFSASGFPGGSGLSISAAGVISGTPTNAAAQASPFNVTVTATTGDGSVNDTFEFAIINVNDAPSATGNSYSIAEDATLNVAAPGVLSNDTDPDSGTALTAVLDANVSHGTLTLNANGSFSYKPNANFNGADSFTYHASDGSLSSNIVTVNITVTDVNDAPVIAPIADQTATELTAFNLNLAAFVSDADTALSIMVYASTTALPAGLTLDTSGLLSGMPLLALSVGDFTVGFTVSDGQNTVAASFRLTVLRAGRADLALSISAAPNPATLNTTTTWTFTITNNAPQVNVGGISLQAVFRGVPFQFESSPPGCTLTPASETQLSCVLGPLAGGATTQVTIPGRGNVAGDVFATGTVSIVGPVPIDETTRNDTATGALSVAQGVSATPAQSIGGLDARAAAAGDLNGDGFVDLAVAAGTSQSSVVLLNVVDPANANKRVLSGAPISLGDQAANNGIVLADLDGDSDLDIVTATGAGTANRVFLNSGAAAFTPVALGDPSWNSRAVAAADINGDLLIDLVFANAGPSPVYINQSGATFAPAAPLGNADSRGVVLVDLFGDTLPELVFANADGGATIYRNAGGTFQLELTLATGPTTSVAAADFNNDGRFDLVFGRSVAPPSGVPSNLVWLNTSTTGGSFFLSNEIGAAPTTAVAVADFDLDGDTDILAVNDTGGHQVYTNVAAASGTFALHPQQIATAGALAAAVGKFSVDDRIDAALVGTNGVAVFYNDGAGNLGSGDITAPTIQLRGEPSITLTVEDSYTDAGATANDTIDGDVTARIVVDNPVNPAVIGTYTVTYNATDLSGNSAVPVTRTVRVQARQGTGGGGGGAAGIELALLLAFMTILRRLNARWRSNAS